MKKYLFLLMFFVFIVSCNTNNSKDKEVKTLTYNSVEEPSSIDPQLITASGDMQIAELTLEGLSRIGSKGIIEKGAAEDWDVSEDGLVWTFKIRENAKWSNGDDVTANDFKFAWERALDPKTASQYAYMLYPIKGAEAYNTGGAKENLGIEILDDKTLKVTLERPTQYFESLIAFPTYYPVNKAFYESIGSDNFALEAESNLSNGPFQVSEWTHDSEIVMIKNENYWNKDSIKLDKIVAKIIPDTSAALNAFNNDELDIVLLNAEQLKSYKNDPRLNSYPNGSVWYLEFNTENKLLANEKIRRAISMAINRDELVSEVAGGGSKKALGFVPTGFKGISKDFRDENGDVFETYNPEKAKQLLNEGLSEIGINSVKEAPSLTILLNDAGSNKKIGEYYQEQLSNILGLDIKIETSTYQIKAQKIEQKDFDISSSGWGPDYQDPMTYMDVWVTSGGNNHTSWSNTKYDELITKAKNSSDNTVRMELMKEAEKILGKEVPIAVIFYSYRNALVKEHIKGVEFRSIGGEFYFNKADIE